MRLVTAFFPELSRATVPEHGASLQARRTVTRPFLSTLSLLVRRASSGSFGLTAGGGAALPDGPATAANTGAAAGAGALAVPARVPGWHSICSESGPSDA